MVPLADLTVLDPLARTAAAGLLVLLAALVARDQGRQAAGRLGAFFALGSAAFAVCSWPAFHRHAGAWAAPILALASGDNLVFWLFARTLFDDAFRLRPWHAAAWAGIVAVDLIFAYALEPAGSGLAVWAHGFLSLSALAFALLAVGQTVATWRGDLVEPRRRIRPFVLLASAGFITITALANLAQSQGEPSARFSLLQAVALLIIVAAAAMGLLSADDREGLFGARTPTALAPPARTPSLERVDAQAVAALEHAMRFERIYRQDGLTIAELARRQGLPEYRLRRLINQGLGWRNFASFLNSYRIADAAEALADPAQAEVPILTIALDAGFGSLGPFNRAFKAGTGLTPSEYRRNPPPTAAVIPISTSRISKPA